MNEPKGKEKTAEWAVFSLSNREAVDKVEITKLVVGTVETNCYIAFNKERNEAVIVDPGDNAEKIAACCNKMGAAVKAILLTHGHFDHVMAVQELREMWSVPVYAYEKEAGVLSDEALNLSNQFRRNQINIQADIWLKDRETFELIGYTFMLLATPGHTCGSCCYYVESEQALFSGDTLFAGSYGRVDFPTGSSEAMLHSVAEILFDLPDEVKVYPGHMGETTIKEEKKYNPLAPYRGKGL